MLKRILKTLPVFLHIGPLAVIVFFWQHFVNWYLSKTPVLGVDLYLSATYVAYHLKKVHLQFNSFKDFWFSGHPLMLDLPQLAFYLMLPFGQYYGPHKGVQIAAVTSIYVLTATCYFLFYYLSKNYGFALFLSVLVFLSPNLYGALVWAGSIPYVLSQTIFPLGLLTGAWYFRSPSRRSLAAMILITGVGILIHPLGVMAFLIPSLLIIILFSGIYNRLKLKFLLRNYFIFVCGFIFASFIFTYKSVISFRAIKASLGAITPTISGVGGGAGAAPTEEAIAISKFYSNQVANLFNKTDFLLFVSTGVLFVLILLALAFFKNRKKLLIIVPFLLIAFYTALHPYLNLATNFPHLFSHDIYRAFWPFPIAVGALGAVLWGAFFGQVSGFLSRFNKAYAKLTAILFVFVTSGFFIVASYVVFNQRIGKLIEIVDASSEVTSAFPEALGVDLRRENLKQVSEGLVPKFLEKNDKNKRLYSADATFNIWWSSFFEMPLVRGYVDPPIGTDVRGGLFWLDIAIANDTLVRDFKISEEVAFNNSLFLMDWYAVNYFEGGTLSSKGPKAPPSSYLLSHNVFDEVQESTTSGAILKFETKSGKPEFHPEIVQSLKFFKVADKYASSVIAPSNSPTIAVFGSFAAYEDLLRLLGFSNINSKKLIPVFGGEKVDDFSFAELKGFDAVFMIGYKYSNKSKTFENLHKYVSNGGNLFIETGAESPESDSKELPEIFPIKSSTRKGYGTNWNLQKSSNPLVEGIDLEKFGPLIFNSSEWKLTTSDEKLRFGDSVLVNGGRPVLVESKVGSGKVIWSGMNLTYHYNQYKSDEEAKLFNNILKSFVKLEENNVPKYEAKWQGGEKVTITMNEKPRGVLFKEEAYDWGAKVKGGKSLPIYLTGPTYPGFMYVQLTDVAEGPLSVEFTYPGKKLFWAVGIINVAAILVLLEIIIFNGFVFKITRLNRLHNIGLKRLLKWWGKEDEV